MLLRVVCSGERRCRSTRGRKRCAIGGETPWSEASRHSRPYAAAYAQRRNQLRVEASRIHGDGSGLEANARGRDRRSRQDLYSVQRIRVYVQLHAAKGDEATERECVAVCNRAADSRVDQFSPDPGFAASQGRQREETPRTRFSTLRLRPREFADFRVASGTDEPPEMTRCWRAPLRLGSSCKYR